MHRNPGDASLDLGLSEEAAHAQAGIACTFFNLNRLLLKLRRSYIRQQTVSLKKRSYETLLADW